MTYYTESDTVPEVEIWGDRIIKETLSNSQAYKVLSENGMIVRGTAEKYEWPYYTALEGFAVRTHQYEDYTTDAVNSGSRAFATINLEPGLTLPISFAALRVGALSGFTLNAMQQMIIDGLTMYKDQQILRDGVSTDGDISLCAIVAGGGHYKLHGHPIDTTTTSKTIDTGDKIEVDDILELADALRGSNEKPSHLFLHERQLTHLKMSSTFKSSSEYGNNSPLVTGQIPMIDGIKIIPTTNVMPFTSAGTDFGGNGYAGLMIDVKRAYGIYENYALELGLDTVTRQRLHYVTATYQMDVEELDFGAIGVLCSSAL